MSGPCAYSIERRFLRICAIQIARGGHRLSSPPLPVYWVFRPSASLLTGKSQTTKPVPFGYGDQYTVYMYKVPIDLSQRTLRAQCAARATDGFDGGGPAVEMQLEANARPGWPLTAGLRALRRG